MGYASLLNRRGFDLCQRHGPLAHLQGAGTFIVFISRGGRDEVHEADRALARLRQSDLGVHRAGPGRGFGGRCRSTGTRVLRVTRVPGTSGQERKDDEQRGDNERSGLGKAHV